MQDVGVYVQESKADGDCLLWSLRALLHEDPELEDESREAEDEQRNLRLDTWED